MSNRLRFEKSPYLLQHQNNPVDWYPWENEAFKKAAAEEKPIFLSIGYSTCHWCHVMAHESFEDEDVASLLNHYFVCIKVDREERPDIDAVYMAACQAMTGSGGWPLTVLMTAEQRPFFTGTYLPKNSRYGQMGLTELLKQVIHLWQTQRKILLNTGKQIIEAIAQPLATEKQGPNQSLMRKAYLQLRAGFDSVWGGFGTAPKFPSPHNLLFLMRFYQLEREPTALKMVETTLQAMMKGGIHDQIGGGFFRYSTDKKWLIPHFEKMLYDNALLLMAFLEAFQLTKKECYENTAMRAADYILRELTDPEGGFYCGQDADSDGIEGKYYVFTPEEIFRILGKEQGADFCRRYHISANSNFEGGSIPNRIGKTEESQKADNPVLQKLYAYRKKRTRLHLDDKILLSWNAWTIIALTRTGRILKDHRYLQAATKSQQFLDTHMTDENNRLYLRFCKGEAANDGQLDSYAVYALALLELYRLTFDIGYLRKAKFLAGQMKALFEDPVNGGYFMNAFDAEQLIIRPKEIYDGAIPSGNSVAAMVLEELAYLTGETEWQEATDRQQRFMAGQAEKYPAGHCFALLSMAKSLYPHKELLCAGKNVPVELTDYLRDHAAEEISILFKSNANDRALAEVAPFTASYPIPSQGTVWYLCENGSCHTPITDFKKIAALLAKDG